MPEPEEETSKNAVPEGIKPVFLSSATQKIFSCEADTDVTGEKPHIFLPKEKLLEDIHNRAAVSDFQPLKTLIKVTKAASSHSVLVCGAHESWGLIVYLFINYFSFQKYPSDQLLLVYDYEFKYEQNFYLCVTEEAKELVLNVRSSTWFW